MIAYIKLKSENKELYSDNFLEKLKSKNTKFSKFKYNICYFFYNFVVFIKYLGNIITVKQIYYSYIFVLPFSNKNISKYKIKRCMKKVNKLMIKYNLNTVALSNSLKQIINIKEYNINCINENALMPYLIKEILNYILEIKKSKTGLEDLYICIKDLNKFYIENIYYLSNYFKTINIITPNINNFKKVLNKLEQNGALVTLANNKEKSLKRAKLILNIDFNIEEFAKYTIYRKAIIISIKEQSPYKNLGFEGIEIKNVQIDIKEEIKELFKKHFLLENYSLCTLYKCLLNENLNFEESKKKMQEDKIEITKLYGNNGEISQNEYLRY